MKKILFCFALVLPVAVYGESVSIVIETLQKSNLAADENLLMTEFLGSYLSDYDQITVLEDEYINNVLNEQKFSLSGLAKEDSLEIGQLINADYILSGTLGLFALNDYFISLKLLNVKKGSLEATINRRFSKLEDGINSMPEYLPELFEPVVSLEKKEIPIQEVEKIVKSSWHYKRNLIGTGVSYSYSQSTFPSSTVAVESMGISIIGVIGTDFLFIIDTSFAFPIAVTGITTEIADDSVNRLVLDQRLFPGYRFHFSENIALVAGIGVSYRAKYISEEAIFGDTGDSIVTMDLGVGSIFLLEYYLSRNMVIQAGVNFAYDFLHLGSGISEDTGGVPQQLDHGFRLQPQILISFNQSSIR